jgi:nucleoredoxin
MEQILGETLLSKSGPVPTSSLSDAKMIVIYMSAHWCAPCREFTPKLELFYESANFDERAVEIVFSSWDRTQEEFDNYYSSMPWLAIPFSESEIRESLKERYGITKIPTVLLVRKDGTLVSSTAKKDVEDMGPLCLSQWERLYNN